MQRWLVVLAVTTSVAARAAEREEAVRFQYRAPEACPTASDFADQVKQRTARGRSADPGELARTFSIEIDADEQGFVGSIEFLDDAGVPASRRVRGEQCDAVVSSLALITALALDATLREPDQTEPTAPPAAPTPRPALPSVVVAASAPRAPLPPRKLERAVTSMRIGASGGYAGAERAARLGILGQLDFSGGGALRLNAHYGGDEFVADDLGRRAKLRVQGLETSVCPWRYARSELSIAPCALVDVGSLRVSGVRDEQLTSARGETVLWATVGAELRFAWEPPAPFWAEARVAGVAALRQGYRFTFENPNRVAYEVPFASLSAGLSGGARFW
jgi:hypothetical protein